MLIAFPVARVWLPGNIIHLSPSVCTRSYAATCTPRDPGFTTQSILIQASCQTTVGLTSRATWIYKQSEIARRMEVFGGAAFDWPAFEPGSKAAAALKASGPISTDEPDV